MSDNMGELKTEAKRFVKQMQARYGSGLLRSMFGNTDDFEATLATALMKSGVSVFVFKSVREWLLTGLKPFAEYPPTVESLVQMSNLVRSFPSSDKTDHFKAIWHRLDTEYSFRYSKQWRGESAFDQVTRERVWIHHFVTINANEQEIADAMTRIVSSGLFRIHPPSLDQFLDTVYALRYDNAPMVEEAWLFVISAAPGAQTHPLIRRCRGEIGAHELKTGVNRDLEQRFKASYRSMLVSGHAVAESIEEVATVQETKLEPKSDVLKALNW